MDANGKVVIAGYLAKSPKKIFRQRNLVDATGLSRQLVAYHCNELLNQGILEKVTGTQYYKVSSYDRLIDILIDGGNGHLTKRMKRTFYVTDEDLVTGFNKQLQLYIALKTLQFSEAGEIRYHLMIRLNETIDLFLDLRKYLQNIGTTTDRAAARSIQKLGTSQAVKAVEKFLTMNRDDFESWLNVTVANILEDED